MYNRQLLTFSEFSLEIAALKALGRLTGTDLIDWAVQGLTEGYDSPALRRLAGAYAREPLSEIEPWFDKALAEMEYLLSPEPLDPFFRPYSRLVAKWILNSKLPEEQGLKRLSELLYQTPQCDRLLYFFSELQDALDFWPHEPKEAFALCPELKELSPETCIRRECELFLAFSQRENLPEELFLWAYCQHCGHWARPAYTRVNQKLMDKIRKPFFSSESVYQAECAHCGTPHPLSMNTQAGRQLWLDQTTQV